MGCAPHSRSSSPVCFCNRRRLPARPRHLGSASCLRAFWAATKWAAAAAVCAGGYGVYNGSDEHVNGDGPPDEPVYAAIYVKPDDSAANSELGFWDSL